MTEPCEPSTTPTESFRDVAEWPKLHWINEQEAWTLIGECPWKLTLEPCHPDFWLDPLGELTLAQWDPFGWRWITTEIIPIRERTQRIDQLMQSIPGRALLNLL